MIKTSATVRTERGIYSHPPRATGEKDDFYIKLAHETLAEFGRVRLEREVAEWVGREARWLVVSKQYAREFRSKDAESRTTSDYYVQQRLWSRKIRTTKTIFVPTFYRPEAPTNMPHDVTYILFGLYIRVTEDGELLWKAGKADKQPQGPFERALVEHLSDNTLALFWDKICRY